MRLILSEILTLRQHLNTLIQNPELYCHNACIYCQETAIWRYGYYYRKPDRLNQRDESQNDIPIARFQCVACCHTLPTLPEKTGIKHSNRNFKIQAPSSTLLHQAFSRIDQSLTSLCNGDELGYGTFPDGTTLEAFSI